MRKKGTDKDSLFHGTRQRRSTSYRGGKVSVSFFPHSASELQAYMGRRRGRLWASRQPGLYGGVSASGAGLSFSDRDSPLRNPDRRRSVTVPRGGGTTPATANHASTQPDRGPRGGARSLPG